MSSPKGRLSFSDVRSLSFKNLKQVAEKDLPQIVYSPRPLQPELTFPPQYIAVKRLSLNGDYDVGKSLGSGISGEVRVGRQRDTGKLVAIKCIVKSELTKDQLTRVRREYSLMKYAKHPNLINMLEVVENPKEINIIMELAEGGDLYQRIINMGVPFTEEEAAQLFIQICEAVCYLHKIGFVHRDIKPENILLDTKYTKPILADLGYSAPYEEGTLTTARCGSFYYAAPEVLNSAEYTGPEVDIWSLGVLLYVMTVGTLPFYGEDDEETLQLINKGKYSNRRLPPLLKDLIGRMIVVKPTERLTIEDVLEHPWFFLHLGEDSQEYSFSSEDDEETNEMT